MAEKKFRFRVKIEGKEAGMVSAITPPVDVLETLRTEGRVPVKGTIKINGFRFRSSLMPMGGCHTMPVNKALCQGAPTKPGDIVDVVMERDAEERTVEPPPKLARELEKSKTAQQRWKTCRSPTRRRWRSRLQGEAGRDKTAAVSEGGAGFKDGGEVEPVRGDLRPPGVTALVLPTGLP